MSKRSIYFVDSPDATVFHYLLDCPALGQAVHRIVEERVPGLGKVVATETYGELPLCQRCRNRIEEEEATAAVWEERVTGSRASPPPATVDARPGRREMVESAIAAVYVEPFPASDAQVSGEQPLLIFKQNLNELRIYSDRAEIDFLAAVYRGEPDMLVPYEALVDVRATEWVPVLRAPSVALVYVDDEGETLEETFVLDIRESPGAVATFINELARGWETLREQAAESPRAGVRTATTTPHQDPVPASLEPQATSELHRPQTAGAGSHFSVAQAFAMADTLRPTQQLKPGDTITANNNRAYLVMQGDGNLVLYERHDKGGSRVDVAAWSTQTDGRGGVRAVMQDDGNFVVYDGRSNPLWHSHTDRNPGARLVLQDDGNLVVYSRENRALWNAETIRSGRQLGFSAVQHGFKFANTFVTTVDLPFGQKRQFAGRCGGMCYSALDYYHAGIPVPRYTPNLFPSPFVPPDGHWLGDQVDRRQRNSISTWSAHKYLTYTGTADMTGWMRDAEIPELRRRLDRGELTVLGMIAPGDEIGKHHQNVAYGYEHHRTAHTIRIWVYDPNAPDEEVLLTSEPGNGGVDAHGPSYQARWKGFFVHDYKRAAPPWFTRNPAPPTAVVTYGATVKLTHVLSGLTLHSHLLNYGHSGSSGQQQVTCFAGADANDVWRVKGPHGTAPGHAAGRPVNNGDAIRLEHVQTGRNLHSHAGFPSPVTGQQEVTCYGERGNGDANDDWRVQVDGAPQWGAQNRVRLVHRLTNVALHSHLGYRHDQWTAGQQEATGYAGRDDNDWWWLLEKS